MALVGVATATWLTHHYGDSATSVQGVILGVALLAGGLGMLAKSLIRFREVPDTKFIMSRRDHIAAFLIGLFGGFIVGLTSVGSGVFFGLSLLVVFPLRSAKVVGTDIFHAAALLWVAGAGHFVAGNVDMNAVGWLLLGSIPGVLLTAPFTVRIPDRFLRLMLGVVLAASGVKLINLPHSNEWAIGTLCFGMIAVASYGIVNRRRTVRARREPVPVAAR